jgi:hypothetical protein
MSLESAEGQSSLYFRRSSSPLAAWSLENSSFARSR